MRLKKTDRRFNLYHHGFDHFLEFEYDDWNNYHRYRQTFQKVFGPAAWLYKVDSKSKWYGDFKHKKRSGHLTHRIYLRGEKCLSLVELAVPPQKESDVYI